jgi:hypothetical protein
MSEPDYELEPPGGSARDLLPPVDDEPIDRLSPTRRQSRTIAPPRKWRKLGLNQRVCRAVVANVQDGFWHLQKAHNQGKGLDLEAWGLDLRDELNEFIFAAKGQRGFLHEHEGHDNRLTPALIGLIVLVSIIALCGVIYVVGNL